MEKGYTLTVAKVEGAVTLSTGTSRYNYRGVTVPNHACNKPTMLKRGDVVVVVGNVTPNKDLLVKGPCGCNFLLYDLVIEA